MLKRLSTALHADDPVMLQLDAVFQSRIASVNPSPTNKVTDPFEKALLTREASILGSTPPAEVTKHRLAETIYGAVPDTAPRIQGRVINMSLTRARWQATGMYVPPGEVVTVQVPWRYRKATGLKKVNGTYAFREKSGAI